MLRHPAPIRSEIEIEIEIEILRVSRRRKTATGHP
jgi:hypothetical protein